MLQTRVARGRLRSEAFRLPKDPLGDLLRWRWKHLARLGASRQVGDIFGKVDFGIAQDVNQDIKKATVPF